jgi:N utilization substance protein A
LTSLDIDVFRDVEEEDSSFDVDIEEFGDEIEQWIIDELKKIGCDTARAVMALSPEELERRTDLEKETIAEIRRILQEELEAE